MAVQNQSPAQVAPPVPSGGRQPNRERQRRANGPQLDAASDFMYLVHPARYDVYKVGETDEGEPIFEVLPMPTKLEFQPGLAGVTPIRDEQNGDYGRALLEKQNKKWIAVPQDFPCVAFGSEVDGYVHVFDGKHGPGTVHLEVWVRPYAVGTDVYFERDDAGWIQFLRDVQERFMPPIDPNVLRGLQAKLKGMKQTAAGAAAKGHLGGEETARVLDQKLGAFKKGATKSKPVAGKKPQRANPNTTGDTGGAGSA